MCIVYVCTWAAFCLSCRSFSWAAWRLCRESNTDQDESGSKFTWIPLLRWYCYAQGAERWLIEVVLVKNVCGVLYTYMYVYACVCTSCSAVCRSPSAPVYAPAPAPAVTYTWTTASASCTTTWIDIRRKSKFSIQLCLLPFASLVHLRTGLIHTYIHTI